MPDALVLYGSSDLDFDLFHAVPASITDPFPYVEADGRRVAFLTVMDADNARATGAEVVDTATLGRDELIAQRLPVEAIDAELCVRACRSLGVDAAVVPFGFSVGVADALRAAGIALRVDSAPFVARRRVKTPQQLASIRRAQAAADAAMGVAAELIHELREGLTSEEVRAAIEAACEERGCELPIVPIVGHGAQSALAHEDGSGPIAAAEPVVVDLCPRDRAGRCWSDMTRTFVAGAVAPPEELARFWALTRESLDRVFGLVRAGADGRAIFEASCAPYEEAGLRTLLSKRPGEPLEDGYYHGLGHGVGLEVHERPNLGRSGDELVAGDVISLEPGVYSRGFGGCRLEDVVLVTEDGCERLGAFPYEL